MKAETYLKHGGKTGLACWSGCSARSSACTCRSYSRIKHSSVQVAFEVLNWVHRDEQSDRKTVAVFVKFSSEPTCCSTTGTTSGFLLLRFMQQGHVETTATWYHFPMNCRGQNNTKTFKFAFKFGLEQESHHKQAMEEASLQDNKLYFKLTFPRSKFSCVWITGSGSRGSAHRVQADTRTSKNAPNVLHMLQPLSPAANDH